jgi:hypothetical protein
VKLFVALYTQHVTIYIGQVANVASSSSSTVTSQRGSLLGCYLAQLQLLRCYVTAGKCLLSRCPVQPIAVVASQRRSVYWQRVRYRVALSPRFPTSSPPWSIQRNEYFRMTFGTYTYNHRLSATDSIRKLCNSRNYISPPQRLMVTIR